MPGKSVAEKARVKPGTRIAVLDPAPGVVESLGLPADVAFVGAADAEMVLVFVRSQAELEERLPAVVDVLAPKAAVWVFYPKGSKAAGIDVSRDTIFSVAQRIGLGPLGLLSIDRTWSAFRLRLAR